MVWTRRDVCSLVCRGHGCQIRFLIRPKGLQLLQPLHMRGVRHAAFQARHGLLIEVLVGLREVNNHLWRGKGGRLGHSSDHQRLRMMLRYMILQIGHLRIGLVAVITLVGLLARVLHPNVCIQIRLLRKEIAAVLALQRREVLVLVVHNQALLFLWNVLATVRHPAAPDGTIIQEREREVLKRHRESCVLASKGLAGSIFSRERGAISPAFLAWRVED